MSKSVYSIVLSDLVVREVDVFASRLGVSRSSAINTILAEHLSMVTPEQELRDVLELVGQRLEQNALAPPPILSDGVLAVRAPVRFKYNPTVRYVVELQSSAGGRAEGELRAGARTQSERLTEALDGFFLAFSQEAALDTTRCQLGGGRFSLRFSLPQGDHQRSAQRISNLLELAQQAMAQYFEVYPDEVYARRLVHQLCKQSPSWREESPQSSPERPDTPSF